ncbi:MFS transporter [Dactylosporangium vinaceum]|uniref:MFS transporter n=1 Tax=Dactylosporangium vinaceum TaxID=53362 RepID=A0ABV5MCF9_9ACTN|nr:MFS transporter [Dactylosporangium vinaceum]UAB92166.1 MFS transporter [Dactylosporangium vinaceum]
MTTSQTHQLASAPARRALAGISLGYFMVLLDMTVLAVAEPDLAASLHASTAGLQWATTAYTIVFAALLLSAGAATDRYGAARLFHLGVVTFTVASLLSALAPALWVLVAVRAVMGAAAAACVPASMALIASLYPSPPARARAIATWAATSGAAVAAGPIAGGALVGAAGWRAVFLINVPLGLLVIFLTRHLYSPTPPPPDPPTSTTATPAGTEANPRPATTGPGPDAPRLDTRPRIDWPAHAAAAAVLALGSDTLITAGTGNRPHLVLAATLTVIALAVFTARDRRSRTPVLDRRLLSVPGVRAAITAAAAVSFALSGALFVLPLVLQRTYHLAALETGLAFLPLTVPFAVNPPLTARIVAKSGPRIPTAAGLALLTFGATTLAAAVHTGAAYPWLAPSLLLVGLGVSFALPALATAIVTAAPPGATGAAAGILNAARQAGACAGVAAMGATLPAGTDWPLLLSGLVTAAALVYFVLPGRPRR